MIKFDGFPQFLKSKHYRDALEDPNKAMGEKAVKVETVTHFKGAQPTSVTAVLLPEAPKISSKVSMSKCCRLKL